jgi:hypothetical protein
MQTPLSEDCQVQPSHPLACYRTARRRAGRAYDHLTREGLQQTALRPPIAPTFHGSSDLFQIAALSEERDGVIAPEQKHEAGSSRNPEDRIEGEISIVEHKAGLDELNVRLTANRTPVHQDIQHV